MKTACVIGSGFVGAACAWQLQCAGFQVSIVDPGDAQGAASWGNAGHLAIEQIDPLASIANVCSLPRRLFAFGGPVSLPLRDMAHWLPFGIKLVAASAPARFDAGRRALSGLLALAMPAWERLAQQTRTSQHLSVDGHYVTWESTTTAARGKQRWLEADLGGARAHAASSAEISQLRARFNQRPVDAVRIQNTGQILDLAMARQGIIDALQAQGAATHRAHAQKISIANGKAGVQLSDGACITPDLLVAAAGIGSAQMLRASEGAVPLIAERGYHVEATMHRQPDALPPVVFEDRSVIVTPFASTLRIAGFTEFSQAGAPPDVRKWQALTRHAMALGLPFGAGLSQWVGARPTLPDYLPAVGRSRAAGNLLYAFGHQHLGLTLAAVTGELVAALATGAKPAVDVSSFDLRRFQ